MKSIRTKWIRDGCTISYPENISIGEGTCVNEFVYLNGAGGIDIGSNVAIGHRVSIVSDEHGFERRDIPILEQDKKPQGISIGDDVYIGCGAVILKGVKVGKGSVIGANAVIAKDIPEYAIVVGIPGRVIDYRK